MMARIFSAMIMLLVIFMPSVKAQVQTYTGVGEYTMSDFETLDVAKQRALLYAKRNAAEQAGTLIESNTEVINAAVTKDEINTMSSAILKINNTKYETLPSNDGSGIMVRATISADVDTVDIDKWLNRGVQERSTLTLQDQELQKTIDEQNQLISDLKKQLENIQTQQEKDNIVQEFQNFDKSFLSNQKIEEGTQRYYSGDINAAMKCYNEAIELDPNNYLAYCNRSVIYFALQDNAKALVDCDKSIELNPNYALSYYNRGVANFNLQNYEQSVKDFTKAIELDDKLIAAYNNRGYICYLAGKYQYALADFNRALEIDPNFAETLSNRGITYAALQDFNAALNDFNRVINIKPDYVEAYYNRGNAYFYLNDFQAALADYNKAIELKPDFEMAKYNRDVVLSMLNSK